MSVASPSALCTLSNDSTNGVVLPLTGSPKAAARFFFRTSCRARFAALRCLACARAYGSRYFRRSDLADEWEDVAEKGARHDGFRLCDSNARMHCFSITEINISIYNTLDSTEAHHLSVQTASADVFVEALLGDVNPAQESSTSNPHFAPRRACLYPL